MKATTSLFDRWARSYDTQPNPLLHLEERTVPAMLPQMRDKHILDVGCGTGRWLKRFEVMAPASLTGVDSSHAMLQRASARLSHSTTLYRSDCHSLPLAAATIDLILCSFTLSYSEDLSAFARECTRVLKPGGMLLLTDMHPVTAAKRQWTRTFHDDELRVDIPVQHRSLETIVQAFAAEHILLTTLEEPSFSLDERAFFADSGKLSIYDELVETPAIYLMALRKTARLRVTNAPWSSSAEAWSSMDLVVEDARIADTEQALDHAAPQLDLTGYVLLPGLINAHDHLEFSLFPNLGRKTHEQPYRNAVEWAREIQERHAETIEQQRRVPLKTRLWWGAIRNLLCGVTTVCHHNPVHDELLHPAYPLRVVTAFGWGHSLAFEADLMSRFASTPADTPFILHAAEGTDAQSREELSTLDRLGLLTHRTVLVHGLALQADEIAPLNRSGASLVLCPTSNRFLFHRSMQRPLIESLERVALGSDSPLTARGDLLDEIRCLHREQGMVAESLYRMVTEDAANVLRLRQGEGRIEAGGPADLIALRGRGLSPAETLARLTLEDVELVLVAGQVQVASQALYERLPQAQRTGLHPLEVDGQRRYLRAPLPMLFETAAQTHGHGPLLLGNKEVHRVDVV